MEHAANRSNTTPSSQENPHPPTAGDMLVVSLRDGTSISGKLALFDAELGLVAIALKGKEQPVKISLAQVQIMHLPTPKQWVGGAGESGPTVQPFQVKFHDDSTMDGETIGHFADASGVHLYPKYSLNKYLQSFVPYGAIKSCTIDGAPINLPTATPTAAVNPVVVKRPRRSEKADIAVLLSAQAVNNPADLEKALIRQKSMPHMRLGEILVSENLVTDAQLQEALEDQKTRKGTPLGELLVEKGLVTTGEIQQSLAKKLGIPFVKVSAFEIPARAIQFVPQDIAEKHGVVPIHLYQDKLVVALENPMDWGALDALRFHTNTFIEPVMATEEDIQKAIAKYYSVPSGPEESIQSLTESDTELQTYSEESETEESDVSDNVIVKLLNKIIIDAQNQGVSDIHIEPGPGKGKVLVRFRKDGSLIQYHELPTTYKHALISRIKILSKLDISEKRRPQDGKIEFKKPSGEKIELRVAIVPTVNGQEDVVMRILAGGKPIPLDKLALSARNYTELKKAVDKPYGLFLVCGPTGSGKTTTLHSVLGYINTPDNKIWTAEDPVEITQKGLRQVQVNPKIGFDFATAMRAFLRADPDVIMVGEMRDKETVHIGVEASLTGHLVFSTLHTNSAPESIVRLLDMGMDPFNFADALLGILAQRLAKRLCSKCKEIYIASAQEMDDLVREYCQDMVKDETPEEAERTYAATLADWRSKFTKEDGEFHLAKAVGCPECDNSGYKGRVGLHELLIGTDGVKRDILHSAPVSQLLKTALSEGMRTLRQDGIEKVVQGITDTHQIRAVCAK
jgi:type II secretory ATPase GspE/PulE/Tfp pilus assembly ATPase PilB-like protein